MPDYHGFSNEDAVRAAIRGGNPEPGMYVVPTCRMEDMKNPDVVEKFETGPVGFVILRPSGAPRMGKSLVQWFVLNLVVAFFCALVAASTLAPGADRHTVFHVTALVALVAYATGSFQFGIWWGQPWRAVVKDAVDGLIFAIVTGLVFAWLWPPA
jgi:hypothetical protein